MAIVERHVGLRPLALVPSSFKEAAAAVVGAAVVPTVAVLQLASSADGSVKIKVSRQPWWRLFMGGSWATPKGLGDAEGSGLTLSLQRLAAQRHRPRSRGIAIPFGGT